MNYKETEYGFDYGAASIERVFSDKIKGWVVINLTTPKQSIEIYITKTGKVRIHGKEGSEWLPKEDAERYENGR